MTTLELDTINLHPFHIYLTGKFHAAFTNAKTGAKTVRFLQSESYENKIRNAVYLWDSKDKRKFEQEEIEQLCLIVVKSNLSVMP